MAKLLSLAGVLCFAAACATSPKTNVAPEWTIKGAGAFKDSGNHVFYGVGIAPSTIVDMSLRRETADNRARADFQRVFSVTVEGSMKDYTTNETERIERALQTFQSGKIVWVKIIDRYIAPDGTVYSLAKVDLDQI